MKRYIAVIELDDEEEIVGDANISYTYRSNGTNYGTDESVELKAEGEWQRMKTYEDGLNEAWEVARKMACLPSDGGYTAEKIAEIFGTSNESEILKRNTAAEVIAKIEEYENRIEVGDEVHTIYDDTPMVVVSIFNGNVTGEKRVVSVSISGIISTLYAEELRKTGRHFPQITEVLKQMQEGEA